MSNKFDELAKGLAQSVTRRAALKRFGVGLAGAVLASFGLANKAQAGLGKTCNWWRCSGYEVPPFDEYVCGRGQPTSKSKFVSCTRIGQVDCSYCSNCC